jgi:CubicO group peptidase (beta-lactamase class C family)
MSQEGNLNDLRYWLVRQWSKRPLQSDPGTSFAYSNMGYTFAGAMIERVAGKTWDELITQRIFVPLNLRTAGLGPQASLGKVDAPLGHVVVDGKTVAVLTGPNSDNPSIVGPAGTVHMSILHFARWAGWNAGEGKRGPALVSPATLRRLHTPIIAVPASKDAPRTTPRDGKYGYGWGHFTPAWAPYPLHQHTGSNGMNLAQIWLDTRRDFAMVMLTNISTERASSALSSLARVLYQSFATK